MTRVQPATRNRWASDSPRRAVVGAPTHERGLVIDHLRDDERRARRRRPAPPRGDRAGRNRRSIGRAGRPGGHAAATVFDGSSSRARVLASRVGGRSSTPLRERDEPSGSFVATSEHCAARSAESATSRLGSTAPAATVVDTRAWAEASRSVLFPLDREFIPFHRFRGRHLQARDSRHDQLMKHIDLIIVPTCAVASRAIDVRWRSAQLVIRSQQHNA